MEWRTPESREHKPALARIRKQAKLFDHIPLQKTPAGSVSLLSPGRDPKIRDCGFWHGEQVLKQHGRPGL